MENQQDQKTEDAQVQKQNQDFPNVPASSDKIEGGHQLKKEIKETSRLHSDGKTDNTDHQKKKLDLP
jgi:hypothetical protein